MSSSKKIGLAFIIFLSALFFGMMISGCPQPIPPPVPGPTPDPADAAPADVPVTPDPFRGRDFDCHLPVVDEQYEEASPKVAACLGSPPLACLSVLLPAYDPATVACLVRDLGFEANNSVLAGTASGSDGTVAANSRIFINSEDLGFK